MTLEPFRSATIRSIALTGDTSLSVPSDIRMRSAQQRVMDQVQTTTRRKSQYSTKSSSGTIVSPISPKSDSVFYDVKTIKTSPNTLKGYNYTDFANGTLYNGSGFVNGTISKESPQVNCHTKMQFADQESRRTMNISRNVSRKMSTMSRQRSQNALRMPPPSPMAGYQTKISVDGYSHNSRGNHQASSRSVPDLTTRNGLQQRMEVASQSRQTQNQFYSCASSPHMVIDTPMPIQIQKRGTLSQQSMAQSFIRRQSSNHSNGDLKTSLSKQTVEGQKMDISMSEAIQYLSRDENYQLYGASFIQHSTFTDDKAKQQVYQMKGIPPLIALLQSPNLQLQKTASAALRNLVYRHSDNKKEVHHCGGVSQVIQLLKDTQSEEIQKHLTGLLWNMSSEDSLKADLMKSTLPVLTEHVVVPYTDVTNINNNIDPEIFYNATGCLRNLSAAKLGNRQAMRKTSGLIDALVKHIQNCVVSDKPDDKSLENCVCALHNLTYGLEAESPQLFTKLNALSRSHTTSSTSSAGPISCFSAQSNKIQQETYFDYPVMEDNNPRGASWLFHSKVLQMYLSLLRTSENQPTLEACCGAMQNLTASAGTVSAVLSHTIVQKLNGVHGICSLLKGDGVSLKHSAVSLLANMSSYQRLQSSMARQALQPLTDFIINGIPNVTQSETEMDETMATACHTAHTLMRAEQEMSKKLLNNSLINSLNNLSHNSNLPMSSKAAAFLLYNLWAEKDFQNFLKKKGMSKKSFVNDITTAAHRSIVVID